MAHKTKQAALKAARADYGPQAIEGVDFQLRNTGAGWSHEAIPAANEPAKRAQAKRVQKPAAKSSNRAAAAKSGHVKRGTAKPASKTELLVSMMARPGGATSKAMEEAVSWKPHSVRGLVGALKKSGVPVESHKAPGSPTAYVIPAQDEGDVV